MQSPYLIIISLVLNLALSGQDTILFRNGKLETGKVIEITPELVKFTRTTMSNGPVFMMYKSDVERIRFENGEVQDFSKESRPVENSTASVPSFQKILIVHKTMFYNDRPLSESKLKKLIHAYPDLQKRKVLIAEFNMMINKKRIQHAWSTAGPIVAGVVSLLTVGYAVDSDRSALIPLAFASGGIILVTALSKAREYKRERLIHMNRIAAMYNSE
jgi:hypothetical protein